MKKKEQKPRANISTNAPVGDPPPGQGLSVRNSPNCRCTLTSILGSRTMRKSTKPFHKHDEIERGVGIGRAPQATTSQKRYPCLSVNMFKMTEIDGYFLVEIGCEKFITSTIKETVKIIENKIFAYWAKIKKEKMSYDKINTEE